MGKKYKFLITLASQSVVPIEGTYLMIDELGTLSVVDDEHNDIVAAYMKGWWVQVNRDEVDGK